MGERTRVVTQLALFRICTVDGCSRQSYVPGSGKGMCGMHYQKWRSYGDPLADHRRTRNVCSVEGCTKWCMTQGICGTHAWRLRNHGSVTPRLQGQVVDGKRICPRCREDKPVEEFTKAYCRPCGAARARARRAIRPVPRRPRVAVSCGVCATEFEGNRWTKFCSPACKRAAKAAQDWIHTAAYRARKKAATVETVDREAVFERDRWTCQICFMPVDRECIAPDPMSPSIDHRVPLVRGGEHSMANCQTAHLGCNVRKGSSVDELIVEVQDR
jgi:5-methylcytosine-specific restriction endonuclease McrA